MKIVPVLQRTPDDRPVEIVFELEHPHDDIVRLIAVLPSGRRQEIVDIQSRNGDNKLSISRWSASGEAANYFSIGDKTSRIRDFYSEDAR